MNEAILGACFHAIPEGRDVRLHAITTGLLAHGHRYPLSIVQRALTALARAGYIHRRRHNRAWRYRRLV